LGFFFLKKTGSREDRLCELTLCKGSVFLGAPMQRFIVSRIAGSLCFAIRKTHFESLARADARASDLMRGNPILIGIGRGL
jgi:hypothetical protein